MMNKSIITAAAATMMTAAFWNQPVYRRYTVDSNKQVDGLKIVFISDLHNSSYGEGQKKLFKMIENEKPDLLFFGGDICDEKSHHSPVEILLKALEGKYPMYYVSGNHEYWMKNTSKVLQMFRDHGVRVLMDESVVIETAKGCISLLGLKDPENDLKIADRDVLARSLEASYDAHEMTGYKILLSHRPEHIKLYQTYDFDLILSGHAHGGQMRLPFLLNGLYAPNQGFFPKYAGGHHHLDGTDFIISRGLSFRAKLPRIMNPPELVVITFE